MIKKGDTLVEVSLALGIFSMVAIAITSVLIGSTSGAQTALETTLAREEIDTQAEALRYIQSSYAISTDDDDKLAKLWKEKIIENAIDLSGVTNKEAILQYHPTSCSNLFSNNTIKNHAFVINPRVLSGSVSGAYVKYSTSKFFSASTYPRLIYGGADDQLVENFSNKTLNRVEGIYVIAVRDPGSTDVVDADESGANKVKVDSAKAYYDFYIRTCWYGAGSSEPSTISTVIRLNDPDAVTVIKPQVKTAKVELNGNNSNGGCSMEPILASPGDTITLPENGFCWKDNNYNDTMKFLGWSKNQNSDTADYSPGSRYKIPNNASDVKFYAIWKGEKDGKPIVYKLDLNTFINKKEGTTSGHEGFNYDVWINGKKVANNVIDYYKDVNIGRNIKILIKKASGYRLSNFDEICKGIVGCNISSSGDNFIVTLAILPDSLASILNSSHEYAINIEPVWVKE